MEKFYFFGHITDDLNPEQHLGGAVSYSAVAISNLGGEATIVTKAPNNHPYLDELNILGVNTVNLPLRDNSHAQDITSFWNTYDRKWNRTERVSHVQEPINELDITNFPSMPPDSVVFIAPVIDEVDEGLIRDLSEGHKLVITPQGYFRKADRDGAIHQRPWSNVSVLKHADLVILSEEDLTFSGEFNQRTLDEITKFCGKVVLTRGSEGLTVFQTNQDEIEVKSFTLSNEEIVSATGAGDSAAASLAWHYYKYGDLKQAATFGAFYPALKLMGIAGEHGMEALPTIDQIREFTQQNSERYRNFLQINQINELII